jgi:hopanoid biosynthesis associated RND transporter like protein HpnN
MAGRFADVGELSARVIEAVDRRPGRVVGVVLVATLVLGAYAARNLGVNADTNAMIAADLPFRVQARRFEQTFRAAEDQILVLVDGESASAAGRAAQALADRLAGRQDLFERVLVVGGGAFFDRNALLYLDVPELEEFTDRLARVQPFLAEIARDPSLVGVTGLLRQAVAARREGADPGMDLAAALDRVSLATEAALAGRPAPDPWGDALIGGEMSESARHRVVSASPRRDFGELLDAAPAIAAIRAAARDLELDRDHGVEVRVTGNAVLNYEELAVVESQARAIGVAAFSLFSAAVYFAVRSARVVLALATSLLVSLVWTNAFAAAAVGHLNQVSAGFNVLVVGLGGELGIHFCLRYVELVAQGRPRTRALRETGLTIGSSLLSSAGTTAIGFLVFLPTDYKGVAELGLISGAGVLLSLLATFTVLPALLALGAPAAPRLARAQTPWLARLEHVPVARSRPLRWTALAVGIGSALLVPRARFDHNPVNLRDPGTESVQAFHDLLSRSETSPWTVDVVLQDLPSAEAMAERIAELPPVRRAVTLADYVPRDQDAKLELLELASYFVPAPGPAAPPPDAAAQLAALARLEAELSRDAGTPPEARLGASEARLADALRRFRTGPGAGASGDGALALLHANVVGTLPRQLADLATALAPDRVGLADLPGELRDQMLAADGRARIQVLAREDLSNAAALEEFVAAVRALAPDATGSAVSLVEWGRVTSRAMQQALSVGLVCMFAFLFLLWRNLWDSVLAFFPLALAALACVAVMVLVDMPFNFANVIVLPMLIGMGIDNGVHLVHRHRTNPEEVDVLATSTARAVFFSALTTVLAFGALAVAPHRGMASLGRLLTLGVAATLVCYVVVLPAVLVWDDQRRRAARD